jgi:acyl-CoA thioesterase-1
VTKAVRPGVTEEQTFCSLLQRSLSSPARPVEVINAGIGGNTTKDGLARFERDVLERDPHVVVLMFGLNDSWIDDGKTTSRLTVDQYRDNLLRMIVTLRDLDVAVVLMTPNPALAPKYDPQRNLTLRPYVEAVRELARGQQLALVDLYAHFGELALEGTELNGLFTDAMHPNPAGQKLIAELLETKLRVLLAVH